MEVRELEAENALLEKEVAVYQRDFTTETLKLSAQLEALRVSNSRLSGLQSTTTDRYAMMVRDKTELESALKAALKQCKSAESHRDKIQTTVHSHFCVCVMERWRRKL
jgi:hypothetical protein